MSTTYIKEMRGNLDFISKYFTFAASEIENKILTTIKTKNKP